MRGLRLFVRPIEPADAPDLAAFLAAEGVALDPPARGLLAKMLGRIVALAAFDVASDGLRLDALLVSGELRRRRVGRFMVGELAGYAVKMERNQVYVDRAAAASAPDAEDFLQHVGFSSQEDRWVLGTG